MNFLLATGNAHKAEEFAELFNPEVLQITAAPEKLEVIEDGKTFHENALKKAKSYYDKYKQPVMADDSGLCVQALPDELGIYSARFGGDGLSAKERAELLLEKLQGVQAKDRSAYFICVLCFYLSEDEYFFFEGRLQGRVGEEYKGDFGFGYDPVFYPEGENEHSSLAMLPDWKAKNSHRAIACQFAENFFKERVCQSR